MRLPDRIGWAIAGLWWVNAAWSTWCVHASVHHLRHLADARRTAPKPPGTLAECSIVVVVPMLHEADRAADCAGHWCKLLDHHPALRLCAVTTERENHEAPTGMHTWDALTTDPAFQRANAAGRAEILHYPYVNRTYGEQLGWALDHLITRTPAPDYLYVANIDSRLSSHGCAEIIELAAAGVEVAQQSSVFVGNLDELGPVATAEAFYQSRWTFEHEIFRYLAGSGQLTWLPRWLRAHWYQHTVGHGLLIATTTYRAVGGLPRPRYGLEDAALGVILRTTGRRIQPFSSLECGDAPRTVRELHRQRATWIRGPLCAPEYIHHPRDLPVAVQGCYGGLKWALGLPAQVLVLAVLSPRQRLLAVTGWLLTQYGPLLRLLAGLPGVEFPHQYRPSRRHVARAVTVYPIAALSCWAGGIRGLYRLLRDMTFGQQAIQHRTRETA
ncbi:hypothetical protein [Nocardia terpenica]|uniref:Glycosyltransferase family 2 protein n=1 Tax=Nocardia terpenica TaxID=455432 RepID=A0A291RR08_9NOCA|nr:hypothetical protein [Nocardia terpenica]ATL70051.1 hypothetical protein CRH09_31560 [Nocardia terpenica]